MGSGGRKDRKMIGVWRKDVEQEGDIAAKEGGRIAEVGGKPGRRREGKTVRGKG